MEVCGHLLDGGGKGRLTAIAQLPYCKPPRDVQYAALRSLRLPPPLTPPQCHDASSPTRHDNGIVVSSKEPCGDEDTAHHIGVGAVLPVPHHPFAPHRCPPGCSACLSHSLAGATLDLVQYQNSMVETASS